MGLTALIWIVGLVVAGYLAYHKREGWGWILFILACTGGSSSKELKELKKEYQQEVSVLKEEISLLSSVTANLAKAEFEKVKVTEGVKRTFVPVSDPPVSETTPVQSKKTEWKETKDRW
jgi:hypothetical protein